MKEIVTPPLWFVDEDGIERESAAHIPLNEWMRTAKELVSNPSAEELAYKPDLGNALPECDASGIV